jgi:hypothetical protein
MIISPVAGATLEESKLSQKFCFIVLLETLLTLKLDSDFFVI